MISFSWAAEQDQRFTIHIKTPVTRVGTFHRLTAAIYVLGFDIVSGDINTVEEEDGLYSNDTILIQSVDKRKNNGGVIAEQLGILMESLLRDDQDTESLLRERGVSPPAPRQFFELEPEIVFEDKPDRRMTEFYLETPGQTGLLFHLTRILFKERIDIVGATINTNDMGMSEDMFYLKFEGGCLGKELSTHIEKLIVAREIKNA